MQKRLAMSYSAMRAITAHGNNIQTTIKIIKLHFISGTNTQRLSLLLNALLLHLKKLNKHQ